MASKRRMYRLEYERPTHGFPHMIFATKELRARTKTELDDQILALVAQGALRRADGVVLHPKLSNCKDSKDRQVTLPWERIRALPGYAWFEGVTWTP